jgi:hypothetical protein
MSLADIAAVAAPAIGALVGGAPGAAAGAAMAGYLGTQSTNEANADIAAANNAWSAQQYATRYQTQVADLKAAGLNPMMAYGQSPGSAPSAQQVVFQNPVASAAQAYRDVQGTHASSSQSYASASQANAAVKQIDANVQKIEAETKNIPIEGDRLKYAIQLLAEQAAKTAQETQSQTITQKVLLQTVQKLKAETSLLDLDVEAAKSLDNIGRESRQLKPIVDIIRAVVK